MDTIELAAITRTARGKKLNALRRKNITPVHLFGHNVKTLSLQCNTPELNHVLAAAGKTHLINLKVDNAKRGKSVIIKGVQKSPLSGQLLHVDFYQVKGSEKTKVEVPVILMGEAPALKKPGAMVEQEIESLTVECLPSKIPGSISVDVSGLEEEHQAVRVKDLALESDIVVLSDPETILVRIATKRKEKAVAAMEAAEAETAKAEAEAPQAEAAPEEPAGEQAQPEAE